MSEQSLQYFAYGSNLLTARLRARVPSATPAHVGFVDGYDVRFHKRSVDGSGKATLVAAAGQRTYGCVFTIDAGEKLELDRVEGLGIGYAERVLRVEADGDVTDAFSYIAMPSHIDAESVGRYFSTSFSPSQMGNRWTGRSLSSGISSRSRKRPGSQTSDLMIFGTLVPRSCSQPERT